MDRNQLMQAVCNDLRPNAIDPQNPYVPVDSVMPTIAQLTAENERLTRVVEQGSWSKSFPSEPGLYLLNRWGTFTAMRVLEGGLVHPANHKGRMAEMFSRRTISGSWFGPIEEDK